MKRIGVPESELPALLAYLKNTYRYEDGGIVHKQKERRVKGSMLSTGYLTITITFKGRRYCVKYQRIVWALCHGQLPTMTVDHINGNRLDNRIENLREVSMSENRLNMLLPWAPDNASGVAGVDKHGCKYRTMVQGRRYTFLNPYEAFYWAIACGKRYRSGLRPSEQ